MSADLARRLLRRGFAAQERRRLRSKLPGRPAAVPLVAQRRFEALGGECELYALGVTDSALEAAQARIEAAHRRFTRFDSGSELSRLNAAGGSWIAVSVELETLLRLALDAHERSGGLVHAGVLPALLAAGYTRTFSELTAADATGHSVATLGRPRQVPPLPDMLEVGPGRARLAPGAALDLGGLAKGWLADRCAERLGPNALVNLGGDLRARGGGPDGDGWPVGFGDRTVLLADLGAATSGTTRRRWGDGLHHLIDPRTGRPSESDLGEVSVLARTAADAEVLAKTALLLGSGGAERWLEGRALGWSLA